MQQRAQDAELRRDKLAAEKERIDSKHRDAMQIIVSFGGAVRNKKKNNWGGLGEIIESSTRCFYHSVVSSLKSSFCAFTFWGGNAVISGIFGMNNADLPLEVSFFFFLDVSC